MDGGAAPIRVTAGVYQLGLDSDTLGWDPGPKKFLVFLAADEAGQEVAVAGGHTLFTVAGRSLEMDLDQIAYGADDAAAYLVAAVRDETGAGVPNLASDLTSHLDGAPLTLTWQGSGVYTAALNLRRVQHLPAVGRARQPVAVGGRFCNPQALACVRLQGRQLFLELWSKIGYNERNRQEGREMSGQDNRVVSQRRLEIGRGYDVLLTVLVVAGFVSVFTVPASALTLGDYGLLALANLIYWFNGVFGWRRWDRTRAPLVGLAYFAGQYILSTFIVYWSYQNIWLLLLPLASQSIELRRRWTLVVCLLLVVSFALPLLFPARLFAGGLARPGDLTPAVVLEAILDFGLALAFILLFSELLVRERQARAELGQAHRRLGEYAGQVEQLATMRERTRLAREVHDSLGHYLTVLSVQREIVTKFLDAEPARARAREAAFRSQELVAEGLAEVRRSVAALRPSPLGDRSLPQAIRCLAGETHESGLAVSFELTGSPCALPSTVETALYRAAQEALTNVRKHAQAHSVTLRLAYEPDGVRLRVRDDGRGRRGEGARDGVGLKGLRERVAALEGSLRAENHLEGGFVVEVTLPCRAASPLTPRPSVGALSPRGRGSLPPSPWGRGCLPPSLGGGVGGGGE